MGFLVLYRKTLPTLLWGSAVLSAFCGPAALAGLWSWPVRLTRTQNLVSIPDLLTQNLYNPGESCSQYRLRSARLEPLLRSSCVCTLPQVQAAREDQGVWPPGVPPTPGRALNTWTLESLFPAPVQASLPGPIFQPTGGQDSAVYWAEEGGLSLDLKAGGALAWAEDSSGHRKGQSQRWEEQG